MMAILLGRSCAAALRTVSHGYMPRDLDALRTLASFGLVRWSEDAARWVPTERGEALDSLSRN